MAFPYQDKNLSGSERVADLLSRLSLAEKVRQLDIYSGHELTMNGDGVRGGTVDEAKIREVSAGLGIGCIQNRYSSAEKNNDIQRLVMKNSAWGIPALFSEEALHGLIWPGCTVFPQQIALAGTFEPNLAYEQGRGIAAECRSLGIHETWSPVLDLARDPRWGRVEEGYGEDTWLASRMAEEMVRGLQGKSLKDDDAIAAEPKHFSGYGAPTGGLNCAPAMMGRHEHAFYCLPVFEAAFRGGAQNAMCSYNSIDGIPVACDHSLLTGVLRGDYEMPGFVRADMTAVIMLYRCHFVAENEREAIRMGLEAGIDMQLYDFPHDVWQGHLIDLVKSGDMDEKMIDRAAGRVLGVKFRLGLFDQPYTDTALSARRVHAKRQVETALNVARKAICLLKNEQQILPLKKNLKSIAVIGPSAATPRFGDYSTPGPHTEAVTLLDGIRNAVSDQTQVYDAKGCDILGPELSTVPETWLRDEQGKTGLTGSYFNNTSFDGHDYAAAGLHQNPDHIRRDRQIDFNWINTQPAANITTSLFTVRWTGTLTPDETFKGIIGFGGRDSVQLWLDDKLIIDAWSWQPSSGQDKSKSAEADQRSKKSRCCTFQFEKGTRYQVKIEFISDQRAAQVLFGINRGEADMDDAVRIAREAEVAVVAVGDSEETCGENLDRADLTLPGRQQELVRKLHATGTPVILVLQNGRPLDLSWEDEYIPAIIEAWHIGEQGGTAIAEVLFGDINPAGRLPMSFPKHVGQLPVHYNRRPFGATKYVEMDWEALYPFGFGLSYTQFTYQNLTFSAGTIAPDGEITVSFDLINTGSRGGEEVPQVYIHDQFSSVIRPYKELAGFERVYLEAGEKRNVSIIIGRRQLRLLNQQFKWIVEPGIFEVMAGPDSRHLPLKGTFRVKE